MAVQFQYEGTLDYQIDAINAVCDLFHGQEVCEQSFTVSLQSTSANQLPLGIVETEKGIGNLCRLLPEEWRANLRNVQARNRIPQSDKLDKKNPEFTVEMETGTGKTYVYLRTILELNHRYGFKKFVIVVPSVAIKEGVFKSLQDMDGHFKSLYGGVPIHSFLYDSARLEQVRDFATSAQIQVMVVTVGSINKLGDEAADAEAASAAEDAGTKRKLKASNVMYRQHEKVNDDRPIDLIANTNPIVIVDEPQSVDGGATGQGKRALAQMNPLCTLRYSATHIDRHHRVYTLDALAAYEKRLVKRIEVAGIEVETAHNRPYVRFLGTKLKAGKLLAEVEIDRQRVHAVVRERMQLPQGADLAVETGRAVYDGVRIGEITRSPEAMEIRASGGSEWLEVNQASADTGVSDLKLEMIRRTIKEHLDKERTLTKHGIKVLSLIFIDDVASYRQHDKDGHRVDGPLVKMFEDEYRSLAKHPTYRTLFNDVDLTTEPSKVHGGYFAVDRKVSTPFEDREVKKSAGKDAAESDTLNLILRDKQRLLDLGTPLKFIFSHTALQEGWDNPNVFQICVMRELRNERRRRQSVGRGLRLCVDQTGNRVRGDLNRLTVIADENYESFARALQEEMSEAGFGVVTRDAFAVISNPTDDGSIDPIGVARSAELWAALLASKYVDAKGKVTDPLRRALRDGTLGLPATFEPHRLEIEAMLLRCCGNVDIADASKARTIHARPEKLLSEEFQSLWDKIKHKTTYRVEFDAEKLITDCAARIEKELQIGQSRLRTIKASLEVLKSGIQAKVIADDTGMGAVVSEGDIDLPDLLTELQDRTQLTRRSIARILTESGKLDLFRRNPQQFIQDVAGMIKRTKQQALVDGIKYQRIGDAEYYGIELFKDEELRGYLGKNVLENTQRSVYDGVVYDSLVEKGFAEQLEVNEAVKVYAKLPATFKIPTPLGMYNPDWAVLVHDAAGERLYLVVETKSSMFGEDWHDGASGKVNCAKKHYETLFVREPMARYRVGPTLGDVLK